MPYVTEMVMVNSVILFDDDDNDEEHDDDDDDDEYLLWALPICQTLSCELCSHPLNNLKR